MPGDDLWLPAWHLFQVELLHGVPARLILLRLPEETPPPGQPTKLRPIRVEDGWAGDFNQISEWTAIAPVAEAKGMVTPTWLPDAYGAWMWRAHHSANPDLKLTS